MVVDIFAKEDLTDMGLLSEPGNFLVSEAGDLVSELSVKTNLNNCSLLDINIWWFDSQ